VAGYNVYTKQNSQNAFVKGSDFALNFGLSKCISVKSILSYTFGQNTSRNEPMRRIPPLNGCTKIEFKKKNWQVVVENLFANSQSRLAQGDIDDNRIAKGGTAGWKIINMYGGYVKGDYSIRMGLQNIFNTDYRTHGSGINSVGRSGWLAFQIHI
jgi:outer membrane receptor protein involved in Fe transport